jgi:16S rRNA (adenine1518-N6/adenine1519-N6)-dimethyltransferase
LEYTETIRQIISRYDLLKDKYRSKHFGQHFLCDQSLLDKIARCALPFDDADIVEIGPGPCGLTRSIIGLCKTNKVYCIEKDYTLEQLHRNVLDGVSNCHIIYGDALKIIPQSLTPSKIIIISNLPYNVGTQLLINWLLNLRNIERMVLMFQKEVADRICASPCTKEYGRLSIISQLLCRVEKLFPVSRLAFYPQPQVNSFVIRLTPKNAEIKNIDNLQKLTQYCFQHRRKMINSILRYYYNESNIELILRKCAIEKTVRPEEISPLKFLELSQYLDI